MSASESTPISTRSARNTTIDYNHTVLFRLPNSEVRSIKVEKDSIVSLGRVGSFSANELIGQPYGFAYEIHEKQLKRLPPRTMDEIEETDATNELINDGEFVQPLTLEEIEALKKSGVHASEIIKAEIEQHANYSLKTEYSKDKYKKRKEAKYSRRFETVEPTIYNICEYWFKKDQNRIRDIRPDTLSQMLNLASVRPGGRYIVVDDASGLLVSSVLDRIGCQGRMISINDADSPPAYPALTLMNCEKETLTSVLSTLNWATAQDDYTPVMAPLEPTSGRIRSERQRLRLDKRRLTSDALMNTRQELFSGEFDGLLVASDYDPFEIVEMLSPYLAGSASIVVQNMFLQPLADLQAKMWLIPSYLAPSITESWLRSYQVLPGRTHPTMNASGSGGFLLHAIKVYDDPNATAATFRQRSKKMPGNAEPPSEYPRMRVDTT
ncbi:Gcd10p-domain-containing protein [Boletus reticuloceps]|uniref:tRNA (adenine(58)-N(1))-methyltransferase non-catalytic subunit TRM6 n=1 Tax=Boletus reticuloceps TaxID=495285 RepID=A0A8I3AFY6_9AGAM|nr:Gcd10p-domain-containing protein [Boletus reticuloceps]